MWISGQCKKEQGMRHNARVGVVTAQGERIGVYTDGQMRLLPVAAPGGYRWRPANGQQVLVLKTGADAESACVLAEQSEPVEDLLPGEVELRGPDCGLRLNREGQVALRGTVLLNGVPLETVIQEAVYRALATQGDE